MELEAIIGQLFIVDGEPRPASPVPGILAQAPARKAGKHRRNDSLFVHLTLEPMIPEGEDALLHDLLDAFVSRYYQTDGTINTAARQGIRHINELLLNWNMNNTDQRREGAITCAIMRQDELYVVQVGPSLALMGHNFGVERIPAHDPDILTQLGTTANLDFRFAHYRVQPGDMLCLAEPRMTSLPTTIFQPVLVDTEVEIGLEELKDVVAGGTARLMLVEFTDEPPSEFPETDAVISTLHENTPRPILSKPPRPFRQGGVRPRLGRVEKSARQGAAAAALGMSKITEGVADVLEQVRPVPEPAGEQEKNGWPIPTAVAILIPIIIGIILTSGFLQWDNTRRVGQLTEQMTILRGLADGEADPVQRRAYYLEILRLGAEAQELRPLDSQVIALQQVAMGELDRLENITRLRAQPIAAIGEEGSALGSVAISDRFSGDIYFLDRGLNRVWRYPAGENFQAALDGLPPEQVLFEGQSVQSHVVGTLLDLIWRPRGDSVTRDGLAVLDARGAIVSFFPTFADTRAVRLGLSSGWRSPSQVKGFSERIYILDSQAGYIWRYYPSGDELEIREGDQAVSFFDDPNLAEAVDFDINSSDGTVVILYRSGQMNRFADGRSIWPPGTLEEDGLSSPMLAPSSIKIIGRGSTASIYVLDPGTGRLLQFALGGRLLAEYRASDETGQELFTRATDFDVEENPRRVFVTAGNTLYMATFEN